MSGAERVKSVKFVKAQGQYNQEFEFLRTVAVAVAVLVVAVAVAVVLVHYCPALIDGLNPQR